MKAEDLTPAQAAILVSAYRDHLGNVYSTNGSQPSTPRALIRLGLITPGVSGQPGYETHDVWGGQITSLGSEVAEELIQKGLA